MLCRISLRVLAGIAAGVGVCAVTALLTGCQADGRASVSAAAQSETAQSAARVFDPIDITSLLSRVDRALVTVSPNGQHVGYVVPGDEGTTLRIRSTRTETDVPMAGGDAIAGSVLGYEWMPDGYRILCVMRRPDFSNERLIVVNLAGEWEDITPDHQRLIKIMGVDPSRPDEVVLGYDTRRAGIHDIFRFNVVTREAEHLMWGSARTRKQIVEPGLHVRVTTVAVEGIHDIGTTVMTRADADGSDWRAVMRWMGEDALVSDVIDISRDGQSLLLLDSRGRDTAALVRFDLTTGHREIIAESDQTDVTDVLLDLETRRPLAVRYEYEAPRWEALGHEVLYDFQTLWREIGHHFDIVDRSADDMSWIIAETTSSGLLHYHLFARQDQRLMPLFVSHTDLASLPLAPMAPVTIPGGNGDTMVGYVTGHGFTLEPEGREPMAAVLLVRGNSWDRERLQFNPVAQWLASRGYLVLTVNTHSAPGFGIEFKTAGYKEWGGLMHDDLVAAGQWLVDQGYTTPDRLAIMGTNYGGVAAMLGVSRAPEVFAAGVNLFGPLNLRTMAEAMPRRGAARLRRLSEEQMGSARVDRQMLVEISPLTQIITLRNPALLVRRAGDARFSDEDLTAFNRIMSTVGAPYAHVVFNPATGPATGEMDIEALHLIVESFLAYCLGGDPGPVGPRLEGSTAEILAGSEFILWPDMPDRATSAEPKSEPEPANGAPVIDLPDAG
jgi:dipeptidyl aminopeptidase/acylaminoacyl peptidase